MPATLAIVAAIATAVRLALLVALHVRPGGIHPVRDTVSDYARSTSDATRRLSTASSWAAAAAWVALGAATLATPGAWDARAGVGTWLLVLGGILAAMPLVPTDGLEATASRRGRIHMLLAIAWFTIAYATIGPLARLLDRGAPVAFGATLHVLDVVAGVALAALVVSLVVRPLRTRTFGIAERVFIAAVTLAPLAAGIGLAVRATTAHAA